MVKIGITVSLVAFLVSAVSAEVPLYSQCQVGATSCGTRAKCVAATTTYAQCLPAEEPFEDIVARAATSLNDGFVAKGKKYWGTCSDSGLLGNAQNAAVIKTHFGALTPENSMKWDSTESSRGTFNYAGGDTLVKFAKDNNKLVRGHCLVWHSQLPGWVSNIRDKATLTTVIQNHATSLVTRWPGLYAWDVVNEALNEDGSYRQSVFSQVLGDSFFKIAFQAARDADPTVKLYYNDYNLDSNNAKVRGAVKIAGLLNSGGTNLLDGLGTQSHLEANGAGGVQAALTALAAAPGSPEVAITELDIKGASSNDYLTVAKACLAVEKCIGITVWGVRDNDSWRSGNSPLLFNGSFQPKPALTALLGIL